MYFKKNYTCNLISIIHHAMKAYYNTMFYNKSTNTFLQDNNKCTTYSRPAKYQWTHHPPKWHKRNKDALRMDSKGQPSFFMCVEIIVGKFFIYWARQ